MTASLNRFLIKTLMSIAMANLLVACGGGSTVGANADPTGLSNAIQTVQENCQANNQSIAGNCFASYSIDVTVDGFASGILILQNNGAEILSVEQNGTSHFVTRLKSGSKFSIKILAPPSGQACT